MMWRKQSRLVGRITAIEHAIEKAAQDRGVHEDR